ncbi:HEAT repeat domain-containing protein [Ruania alba]|uniref:DNA-binding transcriptional regulator, MerR family n=1 Tax=Ruania alba TaxID=648782 RepID=A0A1H5KAQ0_9MICO|nr:HEAT repeat domain-containing protein [Ruania alba]SEE61839.1 DNA-binding transcriptional regulator, MerR family [Ruania alba]
MLIGEVARRSGVSARMLRHYDRLGLVRPTGRTSSGYREYSAKDFRRLFQVEGLRTLGLSLRQVAQALEDPGVTPAHLVGDLVQQSEERLAREQELLDRLRTVEQLRSTGWEDALQVVALLKDLRSTSSIRRQQVALDPTRPAPTDALTAALLTEADQNAAGALRWALVRAGGEAVDHLAPALTAADVMVRRRAVRAVAAIHREQATPASLAALRTALTDGDPSVRRHAALALGAAAEAAAVPTLVAMVIEGSNDVEAAETLGALATDPAAAGTIVSALSTAADTPDPAVRRRIAQALAEFPGELTAPLLQYLATDEDRSVSLTAAALRDR